MSKSLDSLGEAVLNGVGPDEDVVYAFGLIGYICNYLVIAPCIAVAGAI